MRRGRRRVWSYRAPTRRRGRGLVGRARHRQRALVRPLHMMATGICMLRRREPATLEVSQRPWCRVRMMIHGATYPWVQTLARATTRCCTVTVGGRWIAYSCEKPSKRHAQQRAVRLVGVGVSPQVPGLEQAVRRVQLDDARAAQAQWRSLSHPVRLPPVNSAGSKRRSAPRRCEQTRPPRSWTTWNASYRLAKTLSLVIGQVAARHRRRGHHATRGRLSRRRLPHRHAPS